MIVLLSISLNIRFGYSKEPSHRDGSFEYPQHMFWLRNQKIIFLIMHSYQEACTVHKETVSYNFIGLEEQNI